MTNNDNNTSDIFYQNVAQNNNAGGMDTPNHNFIPNNNGMNPGKRPKEKSLLLPILTICLILIVAASAVTFVLLSGRDKKTSLLDQTSLFEGLFDFSSPIDDYLGVKNISKKIKSGTSEISGEFTLTHFCESDEYNGAGFEYTWKRNALSKEMGLDIRAKYNNANVLSANMYMNKNKFQIKIPTKAEDVFYVEFDELFKKMKDSLKADDYYTSSQLSLIDTYLDKENIAAFLGDWTTLEKNTDIISMYIYAVKETYPDDYKTIINGITSERAENDAYGNSGTKYTISENSIELLVKRLLTVSLDNKELSSQLQLDTFIDSRTSTNTISEDNMDIDAIKEELRSELESTGSLFAMFFNDDITVTIWKNKNGLLTGLESYSDLNIAGENITLNFEITSENDTNPGDNMSIKLSAFTEDDSMELYFQRTTDKGKEIIISNMFSMYIDAEKVMELSSLETLDTTDNSYYSSLLFSVPDEYNDTTVELFLSGTYEDMIKGSSYNLVLDSIGMDINDENMFTAKGNISIKTKDVMITAPTGTQTNLTDMSDEELFKLFRISDEDEGLTVYDIFK